MLSKNGWGNFKQIANRNLQTTMSCAYLINQYPKVSHSFIRREILALEELGMDVVRYSIRSMPIFELTDKKDLHEHGRTFALLNAGFVNFIVVTLWVIITSPLGFFQAFKTASSLGRKNKRGLLRHWVYLVEACLLKQKLRIK